MKPEQANLRGTNPERRADQLSSVTGKGWRAQQQRKSSVERDHGQGGARGWRANVSPPPQCAQNSRGFYCCPARTPVRLQWWVSAVRFQDPEGTFQTVDLLAG